MTNLRTNSIDQTELIPEQMIFNLNPSSNDKSLMNNFVMTNNKDEQKKFTKDLMVHLNIYQK